MLAATLQRYRAAFAGLPRDVWLLALAIFVNRSGSMVMPFMTLYCTSQLALSEGQAGRMISVYGLGSVLGAYLGGRLARRFGEVRLQTLCLFMATPLYLTLATWNRAVPLAINIFLLSSTIEMLRPANAAAIAKVTAPALRTRAYALTRLAANLGFSFGPAVGGVLATISFKLLFFVDAATTFAAGVFLWRHFRMRRIEAVAAPETEHLAASPSPLRDRQFVAFLLLMLVEVIVFSQFASTYPLYMRDHYGLTKPYIGLLFAVNTTIIVACEMLLVDAIASWPLIRTIGWGTLLTCVGYGILPFGSTLAYAAGAMVVFTLGEMLSASLSAGYVVSRNQHSPAMYTGWFSVTMSTGYVLGPTLGTLLYQRDHDLPWLACLAVGVVLLAGFELLARGSRATVGHSAADALPGAAEVALPLAPPELRLDDSSTQLRAQ